jgi:outer membrane protein assembly factor BamB
VTRATDHFIATYGNSVVAFPTTCTLGTPCTPSWTKAITTPRGPVDSVSKNTLAVVNGAGTVTAIDETTGATQWAASLGASATLPVSSTNASIFAISGTTLYALRAGGCGLLDCTGTQRWKATLPFSPAARASISGDTLFVGGGTTIAALDATGTAGCSGGICTPLATRTVGSTVTGPVVGLNNRVLVPTTNAVRTFQTVSS